MEGIKERCKIEREVFFYGDNGRVVAKETKYRGNDGLARYKVEYLVCGEWTYRASEAQPEVVAMVKKYRDGRLGETISHDGAEG